MPGKRHATLLAAAAAVVCLAGGASYFFLLDTPTLRSTAAPNIAVMVLGTAAGVMAACWSRRRWTTALAVGEGLFTVLFVLMLYRGFALPGSEAPAAGRTAPEFTLPDQAGRPVALADFRGTGPVLLVFYRGFW